jgi:hypothetical protein
VPSFLGPIGATIFYDLTHRPGLPVDFFLTEIEVEIDGQRYSRAAVAPFTGLIDLADGRRAAVEVHEKAINALISDIEDRPNQPPPLQTPARGTLVGGTPVAPPSSAADR